jgi:hypothetical protein
VKKRFESSDLSKKLARHHRDAARPFWDGTRFGWILTFGGEISKNIFRASWVQFLPSQGTDDE